MSELQKNYDSLKKVHDSANIAIRMLEEKVKKLEAENMLLQMQKRQWEEDKNLQKNIISSHLTNNDSTVKKLENEIIMLRKKLKETK